MSWLFWFQLMAFWPVILVAIGVRLIFDRSRYPWAVLLSPLLMLGTMLWVAVRGPAMRAVGPSVVLAAERPDNIERWTFDARLSYGELDVDSARTLPDKLIRGRAVGGRGGHPLRVFTGDDSARVRLGEMSRRIVVMGVPLHRWSSWSVDMTPDLPVAVDLRLVMVNGDLDLTDVPVTSMDLEGAFNRIRIELGRPTRDVRLELEGAFSRYVIVVPRSVPVRLRTDGLLNVGGSSRGGEGPGYRVNVDGAFNTIDIVEAGR